MNDIKISNEGNPESLAQVGKNEGDVAGRDIHKHYHGSKKENLRLNPQGPSNTALELAKSYWEFITKGKNQFVLGLLIPSIISGFLVQDYWWTQLFQNVYVTAVGGVVLLLQLTFISFRFANACPKCGKGFAISEIERELVNRKKYKGAYINNIKVIEGCRYCDYQKPRMIVENEENR